MWIDEEERLATFPITNLHGQLVGYQQYRPDADKSSKNHPKEGRYFTLTRKDTRGVWGLESWYFSETLFITEGIFDAARLTELGYSAIATMSNDPKHLNEWLWMLPRKIVAVCDEGNAGRKLAKYGDYDYTILSGDLGDATDEEVEDLLEWHA